MGTDDDELFDCDVAFSRKTKPDNAAIAVADKAYRGDAQMPQHSFHIFLNSCVCKRHIAQRGFSLSAAVYAYEQVVCFHEREQGIKSLHVAETTMEQNKRFSAPVSTEFEIDVCSVHFKVLAIDMIEKGHGRFSIVECK
jgi:hypothetical protein